MRCYNHPKEEAVAVCKSCGKGICQNCAVLISGISHCKTCVEEGRVVASTTPLPIPKPVTPTPSGIPSRAPFIIGGVGAIISGTLALLFVLLGFIFGYGFFFWSSWFYRYGFGWFLPLFMIMLGAGVILAGVGYRGIKTNYGIGTGTAGFALSIVAGVLFSVNAAFGIIALSVGTSYYYYSNPWYGFAAWSMIISLIMFGVTQIIWGIAHINSRRYAGNSSLGMATGVILIVSGALTATVIVSFVGLLLFLVSGILTLLIFLMSEVPQVAQTG